MRCPFCGATDTQVKDSRPAEEDDAIRRRRACTSCGMRFTTFERVHLRDMVVIKRDGSREAFNREKLHASMRLALSKRSVGEDQFSRIINSLIRHLEMQGDVEISSKQIGSILMAQLSEIDIVAYIRYASVYQDFREVCDFNSFIEKIRPKDETQTQETQFDQSEPSHAPDDLSHNKKGAIKADES